MSPTDASLPSSFCRRHVSLIHTLEVPESPEVPEAPVSPHAPEGPHVNDQLPPQANEVVELG